MSDRNGSDFGAFVSGVLMGGIIGAVAALLMAPQSGEETRKVLREKGIELRDMSNEALEKAAAEARARADELTRMAEEQATEWRKSADELRKRGEETVEDIRARGEAALEAAKTPKKSTKKSS